MVSEKILDNLMHFLPPTVEQQQRIARAIDESPQWKFLDISYAVGVPAVIVGNGKTGNDKAAYVVSREACMCPDYTDRVHPAADRHLKMCKHQIGAALHGLLATISEVPTQNSHPVLGDADAPPAPKQAVAVAANSGKREAALRDREALWPRDQYGR